jgi:hypothetical protein
MTAQQIVSRLFDARYAVTAQRVSKAHALAARSKITWAAVVSAMTSEQRAQVEGAQ